MNSSYLFSILLTSSEHTQKGKVLSLKKMWAAFQSEIFNNVLIECNVSPFKLELSCL